MKKLYFSSVVAGFIFFLLFGCARVHRNSEDRKVLEPTGYVSAEREGQKRKAGMAISCHEEGGLSSRYFGVVLCAFENTSPRWIKLSGLRVDFADSALNKHVFIPAGAELKAWASGVKNVRQLTEHNANIVAAAIALGGIALMVGSKNSTVRAAGAAAALGGSEFLGGADVRALRENQIGVLPGDHLLAGNLIIPPGMFVKRWILLYTPEPDKPPVVHSLKISFEDPEKGLVTERFAFRDKITTGLASSSWQYKQRKPKEPPEEQPLEEDNRYEWP